MNFNPDHIIITIGCEYGAGGPQIGKMLADALGIDLPDAPTCSH